VEPIIDFDLGQFLDYIRRIEPEFVSIGADSKGHNLPEPDRDKLEALIVALGKITEVKLKNNINRLRR